MDMVNARICARRDTTANWAEQMEFVPLLGEICIYTDHGTILDEYDNPVNVPGIKIGDGVSLLSDLPFVSDDEQAQILTELRTHTANRNIHVTEVDKAAWNDKADKAQSFTTGNFAALDETGGYVDSGHKHSDYLTEHQDISGKMDLSLKGAANGVAELDGAGKVPSSQLPGYVDDVVEGYYYDGNFYEDSAHTTLIDPEDGKIYVDVSTNITYRWSGSTYVAIGSDLALGETSTTAYRGDRGKIAYDHATDSNRLTSETASGLYKVAVTSEGHVAGVTAVVKSDITGLGVLDSDVIAAEYDATATYEVGDFCIHDTELYKCSTAISTAEEWDSAHWTQTSVTMETPDLSGFAPKDSPVFTSSISMGRADNTTVGSNSVAEGSNVTASGSGSHAEGSWTIASGNYSHAEGTNTTASGTYSHAEGTVTVASNSSTHAEGLYANASGNAAHAEGYTTFASGDFTHAEGYGGEYIKETITYTSGAKGQADHSEGYKTIAHSGGLGYFGAHAEGYQTQATAQATHAEGQETIASGRQSHAEGYQTTASGAQSHAEGCNTTASVDHAHAEGCLTTASGYQSHAEGNSTTASGTQSHAEGYNTVSSGAQSHTEGSGSQATSTAAHSEGNSSTASGEGAHAEGANTLAQGNNSHAEGYSSDALAVCSHAEGYNTTAGGDHSHAEGNNTFASGTYSHAEGLQTTVNSSTGTAGHAEGYSTVVDANYAHAEGQSTIAAGTASHAEGMGGRVTYNGTSYASGARGTADHAEGYQCLTLSAQPGNHAEGFSTKAVGGAAHTEGNNTVASGNASHAEGNSTTASAANSHAEGGSSVASGYSSHAEGTATTASQTAAHAEGAGTVASGGYSHAEGGSSIASGTYSHAEGCATVAAGKYSHTSGSFNVADSYSNWPEWVANTSYDVGDKVKRTDETTITGYICKTANNDSTFTSSKWTDQTGQMNYAEIVGNGTADNARSNARTLDWDGNERLKGNLYVGCNADSTGGNKVATESYVTGLKGANNGLAELDSSGKVPSSQLPSYVDDVEEYSSTSAFPATGESSKIYIALDTNKTYRWGGSEYVVIGSDLALGETSSTAYRGDRGAAAYAAAVTNVESAPTSGSANLITSGGVYTALGDYAPKANPVFTGSISLGRSENSTVGSNSVAEGVSVTASGANSHAEGAATVASGSQSHAEGANTSASAVSAHAEGGGATASGNYSHAEGSGSQATSTAAHAEGTATVASNSNAHSEGNGSTASGECAHAEGYNSLASGDYTHAEGYGGSYTQNDVTYVSGATTAYSHSEGYQTIASGSQSGSHAEGYRTRATGSASHAEGLFGISSGAYSHAEGQAGTYTYNGVTYTSEANGTADHVEGFQCLTVMSQPGNHAEGYWTRATGGAAHSEGVQTLASGNASHAEGNNTIASGSNSHAEGNSTIAAGNNSHTSGMFNIADSYDSWPEWAANTYYNVGDKVKRTSGTTVSGYICKTANNDSTFTSSKWTNQVGKMNYAEIIGNGTGNTARSNARTLDWSGNERLMGQIYVGCNADSTGGTQLTPPVGMTGATSSTAGTAGYVPAPAAGDDVKYLKGDGTWGTVALPSDMTGATSSAAGTHGLAPAPAAGDQNKFLRGDGTWAPVAPVIKVAFSIATTDWTLSSGMYTASVSNSDFSAETEEIVNYDSSVLNLNAGIAMEKDGTTHDLVFTTKVLPDGAISGSILSFGSYVIPDATGVNF